MRSPEEVLKLFAYNRWANARVLDAVGGLSADELSRPLGGSFPSLLETLAHLYAAEWIWLERWHGRSPRGLPGELGTLDDLRRKWTAVEEQQTSFVSAVAAAALSDGVVYVNVAGESRSYPLGELLVHLVNHSTYHRGQAVTMLRQLGKSAPSTDYILFLDGAGSRAS